MHSFPTQTGQQIHIGENFMADLEIVFGDKLAGKLIYLVTGSQSLEEVGLREDLKKFLQKEGSLVGDERVSANPVKPYLSEDVKNLPAEVVFAVGGGSVIDYAKKIAYDYFPRAKVCAVYARFGSGTIVTPFAIYDNDEFKVGDYLPESVPSCVYCNLALMNQLSRKEKAVAVSDILAHAIESLLSTAGDRQSDQKARTALSLLGSNPMSLPVNTLLSADINAALAERESLVLLPHAIGHYFTYRYNIPHGIASILPLKAYLSYLADNNKKQVPTDQVLGIRDTLLAVYYEENSIGEFKLEEGDYEKSYKLIKKHMGFAIDNSPEAVDEESYYSIIRNI